MMAEVTGWAAAGLCGALLGVLYFGGLWLTLQRLPAWRRPRRWLAFSYTLRLTAALVGFGIVTRLNPEALGWTLGAFFLVRVGLTRRVATRTGGGGDAPDP